MLALQARRANESRQRNLGQRSRNANSSRGVVVRCEHHILLVILKILFFALLCHPLLPFE
jgi:hypothetical protein